MTVSTANGHVAEHEHNPARSQQLGVLLLIVADLVFVLSLVFTYFYLRGLNTDGGWIPKGTTQVNPAVNWIIAAVVVVSALVYRWGEVRARSGGRGALVAATGIGLILVLADLAVQVWRMVTFPEGLGTGSYASTIMTMGGAHVFHLVITLFLGLAVFNRARRGLTSEGQVWHYRMVGYWWTWVAVSAVIIALTTSFVAV